MDKENTVEASAELLARAAWRGAGTYRIESEPDGENVPEYMHSVRRVCLDDVDGLARTIARVTSEHDAVTDVAFTAPRYEHVRFCA